MADVVTVARTLLGRPYVWGGTFENGKGGDCSGLVVYAFKHAYGISLPHYTGFLISKGTAVSRGQLEPGDLVFPDSGHVQIYTGGGRVIEAPQRGTPVREVPMWGFWRARRIVAGAQGFGPGDVPIPVPGFPQGLPGTGGVSLNPLEGITDRWDSLVKNGRQWVIRGAEILLGLALIVVGVAKVTNAVPIATKIAGAIK